VVAIPAEGALAAISELVETDRAESIILIPGGFAETGEQGLATAIEEQLARGHAGPGGGPVMVGGNCLGIVSRDQYNTFFIPEAKLPFHQGRGENLAIVSQSGAYLVTFASNYDGIIQPQASISYGNQMDLTVADFLAHFLDDARIDVIACYIEGFRPGDGERFLASAAEARRRGKRVVVFKAGKTALGARAAASHTASLAGDYAVAAACLRAAGVDVAETLDEFEDLLKTFTLLAGRRGNGRRVGILSNAGFECSTVMDALGDLELASFDADTRAALDAALPGIAHRDNPVDATPMADTDAYAAATAAILAAPDTDAAILSAVPVTGALETLPASETGAHREDIESPEALGHRWLELLRDSAKPAVVVIDSGRMYDPLCRQLESAGVPVFRKIDRAARALAAFCRAAGSRG
jgi:acyl-CoA synthetase (NDP forming)